MAKLTEGFAVVYIPLPSSPLLHPIDQWAGLHIHVGVYYNRNFLFYLLFILSTRRCRWLQLRPFFTTSNKFNNLFSAETLTNKQTNTHTHIHTHTHSTIDTQSVYDRPYMVYRYLRRRCQKHGNLSSGKQKTLWGRWELQPTGLDVRLEVNCS